MAIADPGIESKVKKYEYGDFKMDFLRRLLRDTHLNWSLPSWKVAIRWFGRIWLSMSEPRPIRRLHTELINKIAAGEVCLSNLFINATEMA